MAFQLFRGTDAQVAGYTGADGELVYNMTNKSLHIYDGITAGGFEFKNAEAMKQDLLDGASAAYDTLKEIEDYINSNEGNVGTILTNMTTMQTQIATMQTQINDLIAEVDALKMNVTSDGINTTYEFDAA